MKIQQLRPSEITPYYNNPRKNDEAAIKVAESIKAFGFRNPIIVDKDMVIIAGHTRWKASLKLNLETVPVIVAADMDQEKVKAYRIADNRVGEFAEWDWQALEREMEDFSDEIIDLLDFDIPDTTEPQPGLIDDDEVPEVTESICKPGDLWKLGDHRLLCGDATNVDDVEKLMDGTKADMVFTDPPYGVDYDGGSKKREKLKDDHIGTNIYADVIPIIVSYCVGPCYTWYADTKPMGLYNAVSECGDIHALLIWVKNNSTFNMNIQYKQKHEPCLYWKPKGTKLLWCGPSTEDTVWEFDRESKNEYHPTQKPVALAERAIKNHSAKSILDLFLGSGSTLIACEKTNRKCYGMEIDPHYCDVIIKRWEDYTGKKATLLQGDNNAV